MSPSGAVGAQQAVDYRVMIPDFLASDGNDRGWGKDVADELRDRIAEIPGYVTIERGDIQTSVDKYNLEMNQLDCPAIMQLGGLELEARVAFCVNYVSEGDNRTVSTIEVWDLWDRQSFTIDGFSMLKDQKEAAADQIYAGFDAFVQQAKALSNCAAYAQTQTWEDALRNCDQALALNPDNLVAVKLRADIYRQLGRNEESLADIERVVAADPLDDAALRLAGYLATQLGNVDKGRDYYRQYLELNPGDVGIRRTIAFDMNEAGDPEGAMQFIEQGLAVEEDVELLLSYGIYAFQAADMRSRAAQADNGGTPVVTPEMAELYRKAIDAFEKIFAQQGAEMDVAYLRNTISAYMQIQDFDGAVAAAERFLAAHQNDAEMLSRMAQAHDDAGRPDEALATLQRLEAVDPNYTNLYVRQGMLMVNAGRFEEAIPLLQKAVQQGQAADDVAQILLAEASKNMQPPENWAEAVRFVELAKQFPVSDSKMQEFHFFHGYSLYQRAVSLQPANDEPPTLAIARQTLPMFQEAARLVELSRPYARANNRENNVNQIIGAANQYIEIMNLTIQRGGGR